EEELKLEKQIPLRHTNRNSTPKEKLNNETKDYLKYLVESVNGAQLTLIEDAAQLEKLAQIATKTDLLRMFIPEAHEDFIVKEMRWTEEEVAETENGIGIHTLDLNNNDLVGIKLLKDRRMIDFLQKIK